MGTHLARLKSNLQINTCKKCPLKKTARSPKKPKSTTSGSPSPLKTLLLLTKHALRSLAVPKGSTILNLATNQDQGATTNANQENEDHHQENSIGEGSKTWDRFQTRINKRIVDFECAHSQ